MTRRDPAEVAAGIERGACHCSFQSEPETVGRHSRARSRCRRNRGTRRAASQPYRNASDIPDATAVSADSADDARSQNDSSATPDPPLRPPPAPLPARRPVSKTNARKTTFPPPLLDNRPPDHVARTPHSHRYSYLSELPSAGAIPGSCSALMWRASSMPRGGSTAPRHRLQMIEYSPPTGTDRLSVSTVITSGCSDCVGAFAPPQGPAAPSSLTARLEPIW